jgi:hypothetical protein
MPNPLRSNPRFLLLALLLVLFHVPSLSVAQERVRIDALGDLEIAWATLEPLAQVPGPRLRAEAQAEPGAALQFRLPAEAQRAAFRVQPGTFVQAGDPVAVIEGPEVHHWLLEYDALAARYETARQRYERNLALYREGALSGERWTAIEERYFELRLEFQHMGHLREWLQPAPGEGSESVLALAPRDGRVLYDSAHAMLEAGAILFEVLPPGGLRLRVEVPAERATRLAALAFDACEVAIDRVEEAARGFYRAAWSAPLRGPCALVPGTSLGVEPRYEEPALLVPREAVFQWRQAPHVWLRRGEELVAQPVELIADTSGGYAVTADPALTGAEVLVRSVSAVQGILLGLGDG